MTMTSGENGPIKMTHFPCDALIWVDKKKSEETAYDLVIRKSNISPQLFKIAPRKTLHFEDFEHRLIL